MKTILYFQNKFLLPHIRMFILVLITGAVAASASGMGVPLLVKFVFPVVFYTAGDEMPELLVKVPSLQAFSRESLLLMACAMMPLVFIIRGLAMWGNALLVNIMGIHILETLRMEVFKRVQELPIAFMESRRKGDVISRITADTTNVQNILTSVANDLIKQPVTAACALGAFVYLLLLHLVSLDNCAARLGHAGVDACADSGKQGNAERGTLSILSCLYRTSVQVGKHLTPQRRCSATAASHHVANIDIHLAHHLYTVAQRVRNTLHNSAEHILLLVHCGQTKEHTSCIGVEVRSSFAVEIRHIQQAVCTDRNTASFLVHEIIRVNTHSECSFHLRPCEVVPEPLEGMSC